MHHACQKSCQASSPWQMWHTFQNRKQQYYIKCESYLHSLPADAFPVCLVIHVFAVMPVVIVPAAVAVPFIHHLSYLLLPWRSIILGGGGCFFQPSAPAGSCTLQSLLCELAFLHTPLNASLLLQHIIFADHKIHPQRFPGRTWH